jgi:hypothetical protein
MRVGSRSAFRRGTTASVPKRRQQGSQVQRCCPHAVVALDIRREQAFSGHQTFIGRAPEVMGERGNGLNPSGPGLAREAQEDEVVLARPGGRLSNDACRRDRPLTQVGRRERTSSERRGHHFAHHGEVPGPSIQGQRDRAADVLMQLAHGLSPQCDLVRPVRHATPDDGRENVPFLGCRSRWRGRSARPGRHRHRTYPQRYPTRRGCGDRWPWPGLGRRIGTARPAGRPMSPQRGRASMPSGRGWRRR